MVIWETECGDIDKGHKEMEKLQLTATVKRINSVGIFNRLFCYLINYIKEWHFIFVNLQLHHLILDLVYPLLIAFNGQDPLWRVASSKLNPDQSHTVNLCSSKFILYLSLSAKSLLTLTIHFILLRFLPLSLMYIYNDQGHTTADCRRWN